METLFQSTLIQQPLKLLTWWSEASLLTTVLATVACGLLTLFLTTVLWRWYFENCRDPSSSLPLPPGSFGWPVIGETLRFLRGGNNTDYIRKRFPGCGISKTHIFGMPMIRVNSDKAIAQLVGKEPHAVFQSLPTSVKQIFGENGVSVISGKDHASMKKILREGFSPVRLSDLLPTVQACVRRHVTSWTQGTGENKMLGFKACQHLVCDLILETVVGCTRDQDPDGAIREAFVFCNDNMFCVPVDFPGTTFHKALRARQKVVDFARKRIAAAMSSEKDYVSILDVLLTHLAKPTETVTGDGAEENSTTEGSAEKASQPGSLTKVQLEDNVVTIMLAGTDTVSSALCNTLDLLGKHPDKLAALREELASQDLLDSSFIYWCTLCLELLQSMPYLQAVTKEILRVFPPVAALFRLTKKTIEVEDFQIPANWHVQYSLRGLHYSTEAFTDRGSFLPERWLDPNFEKELKQDYPSSYLPFGIGSRMCLGKEMALLEMSVFTVEVARLIDWTLLNPDARRVLRPVEKTADDLPITVRKRK